MLPEDWPPAVELLEDELLLELLEEELDDDELLLELLEDELLEDELLLGVDGVCGVVGLLALGQPLRTRQAQAGRARRASQNLPVLFHIIGPDYSLRLHRFPRFEAGSEPCLAQLPHNAVGPGPVDVLVFVYPLQVHHPAALGNLEF